MLLGPVPPEQLPSIESLDAHGRSAVKEEQNEPQLTDRKLHSPRLRSVDNTLKHVIEWEERFRAEPMQT